MAEVHIEPDPEIPTLDRYVMSAGIDVAFVPQAGMVGTSLLCDGRELLGRRGGLTDYVGLGKTFGIPLLAPWANRLANPVQQFAGKSWTVAVGDVGVHPDEFSQPIHGLLAASDAWVVDEFSADAHTAQLIAHLDFNQDLHCFAGFPFEHRLTIVARLHENTLGIETIACATGSTQVPIAFGWHPYFSFPDTERRDWVIDTPFIELAELSDLKIPTGQVIEQPIAAGSLADRAFDDVYVNVPDGARARISGTETQISVRYVSGYSTAVVFAPLTADVICFEPMTAPTDPFSGKWPINVVEPGQEYRARFEIEVSRTS